MKFISEAVANWQVERLESLIGSARSKAKANKLKNTSLVAEHLNLADEHLDDAISAMKYRKFDQASYACQSGFVQLGLAELLLQYGDKIDSGMKTILSLSGGDRVSEAEELALYLASSLAEMKVAIEYSNCQVSDRAQSVLDKAMNYYNDSLKAIKESEEESSKHTAQSGLLCLHLASELIGSENQMGFPGWRGLSNPMLAGPLRRASQLIPLLAEARQRLHQKEKCEGLSQEEEDKNTLLRRHWEKSYNDLLLAIQSMAAGTVAHAQALLKGSLREAEICREIIGMDDPDEVLEELESEISERTAVADAIAAITEAKEILAETKLSKKEYYISCLDKIGRLYREALKEYEREQFDRAEKSLNDALLQLDLLRQQIYFRKQKSSGTHPSLRGS